MAQHLKRGTRNSKLETLRTICPPALALLLGARLVVQLLVIRAGFVALTADDFGRSVAAGRWALKPFQATAGAWLPLHMYGLGGLLEVYWDLDAVPHVVTLVCAMLSIVALYHLAAALFGSRVVAVASAALLAANPVHIWLAIAPLAEMPYTALVLAALLGLVRFLGTGSRAWLLAGALCLGAANGLRYEGWVLSLLYCIALAMRARDRALRPALVAAVVAICCFPVYWIALGQLNGTSIRDSIGAIGAYKLRWYGEQRDPAPYLAAMWRIDPWASIVALPAIAVALVRMRSAAVRWYAMLCLVPLAVWIALHGGQTEPAANYLRYLAPFVFVSYPFVALLLVTAVQALTPRSARPVATAALLAATATTQVAAAFGFANDPAADGWSAGRRLRELRGSAGAALPALIEVSYWHYLGLHAGANDLTTLLYDRELDIVERGTVSLLTTDLDATRACLAQHRVGFVVLRAPELRAIAEQALRLDKYDEVAGYALYRVPAALWRDNGPAGHVCPLVFGSGY